MLLLSGCACLAASFGSRWLPDAEDRFAASERHVLDAPLPSSCCALLRGSQAHRPPRPRRRSLPLLVCCIAVRFEAFFYVEAHEQCSAPGIEVRGLFHSSRRSSPNLG